MNWTHQKRAYKARLLQWDGTNLSTVSAELRELGYEGFELERGTIMARGKGMSLLCIHQGNWLRFGQNGSFKVMRPDEQRTYVPIQSDDDLRAENAALRTESERDKLSYFRAIAQAQLEYGLQIDVLRAELDEMKVKLAQRITE
jgi:hypothetical protein